MRLWVLQYVMFYAQQHHHSAHVRRPTKKAAEIPIVPFERNFSKLWTRKSSCTSQHSLSIDDETTDGEKPTKDSILEAHTHDLGEFIGTCHQQTCSKSTVNRVSITSCCCLHVVSCACTHFFISVCRHVFQHYFRC